MDTVKEDGRAEYFFVATLPLYKNVTDARLASCIAARNLAKHRRFYKGSFRNIPVCHPFSDATYSHRNLKLISVIFEKVYWYYLIKYRIIGEYGRKKPEGGS